MKRLILFALLVMLAGCKSHKTSSKSETTESTKSELVTSKVDSSATQSFRSYEKAVQSNFDRGTSIMFDSLSTVRIEPSGVITATGYGARISHTDSSQVSQQVILTEQTSTDSVSRTNESKTAESQSKAVTDEKEVKRDLPWPIWILIVVCVLGGIAAVAFQLFENFQPFKSLLKWIIKTLGRKS